MSVEGKAKEMRKEYYLAKAKKNPSTPLVKRQVTIRLDEGTVDYFKKIAKEAGIPYQTLINLYLRDCAASGRKLSLEWKSAHEHT
jgi:uncharacterized protein (DUF4415 family)